MGVGEEKELTTLDARKGKNPRKQWEKPAKTKTWDTGRWGRKRGEKNDIKKETKPMKNRPSPAYRKKTNTPGNALRTEKVKKARPINGRGKEKMRDKATPQAERAKDSP